MLQRNIYWQKCAWADTQVSVDWVENTLAPAAKYLGEFILFCDNLTAQTSEQFLSEVKALDEIVCFGVKDATDIWQPIDHGCGALSQIQDEWLESDENIDLWLGNSEKNLIVSDRRILITHWLGEAHERLHQNQMTS